MTLSHTPIDQFLSARSIAIFGASPCSGTLGNRLFRNCCEFGYTGKVFLINPKYPEIAGRPCYPSLDSFSDRIDLALIAAPTEAIPGIVEAAGLRGARAAVIYSAGFRETGEHGLELLRLTHAAARKNQVRLMGPRALGFIRPGIDLNATLVTKAVPNGNLALVSQSSSICASILDWSVSNDFGFSAMFSLGDASDIDLPEVLDFLATDIQTESILLYLEGLHDARRFLSAARTAASVKPVIAIKAGRHRASARLAEAHTDARVDRDDAFDAALRRAGVLRVNTIGDMFSAARALTTPRKPHGNRLAIVTNGGGPAVMAIDLASELDIAMAELAPQTLARLAKELPPSWTTGNPVDVRFDTTEVRIIAAISACLDDPGVDGVIAIVAPNSLVEPTALAHATIAALQETTKPLLTCWMGEVHAREARAAFAKARLPTFRTPENAITAFSFMVNWVRNQALLQETPPSLSSYVEPDVEGAKAVIEKALAENRHSLSLPEAETVLAAFHIPVSCVGAASSIEEVATCAASLGCPIDKKALGIRADSVGDMSSKRELRISIRTDRVFGPVIALSEAGIGAYVYDMRSIGLPPLNPRLIAEMVGVPHIDRLLGQLRQLPAVAQEPLKEIMQHVSEMASELPWIAAMDINPLIVYEDHAVAVGMRIDIQSMPEGRGRYDRMAICPYPSQYAKHITLKDDSKCLLRPIRPEDAALMQDFVRHLSQRSKYLRFFNSVNELPQHMLARYTQIDYGRELTLIAVAEHDGQETMLGEANYSTLSDGDNCEFAIVIADKMAGRGLASLMMRKLMEAARQQGLKQIRGEVLADNEAMLGLMESLDFQVFLTDEENLVEVKRTL